MLFTDTFTADDFDELALFTFGPDADCLTLTDALENGLLQQFFTAALQHRGNV